MENPATSSGPALAVASPDEPLETLVERLRDDGYLIFPSLLPTTRVEAIREALAPHLRGELPGRNDFEGFRSERVYALLAKSPVFAELVSEPLVLELCEAILGPGFLLSACLAIQSHPGETPQALHYDDAFYYLPRPRPCVSLSTFWAIDPFSEENGATEIIPGSHRWGDTLPDGRPTRDLLVRALDGQEDDGAVEARPVVMPAGSLMVAPGTLWHRGGANRSQGSRLAITPQYCAAWARQQENMTLAVPAEVAAGYPERVRELLGYSIHPPFMGHVNGLHPARTLFGGKRGDRPQ